MTQELIEFIAKVEADIEMYSWFDGIGQQIVNEAHGIITLRVKAGELLAAYPDQEMVQAARTKAAAKWDSIWEDGKLVPKD